MQLQLVAFENSNEPQLKVRSSPVFFPFSGATATATGLPNLKKRKNWTETVKDRSVPVFIGSTTGLDRFSFNQLISSPSQFKLIYLFYFVLILLCTIILN